MMPLAHGEGMAGHSVAVRARGTLPVPAASLAFAAYLAGLLVAAFALLAPTLAPGTSGLAVGGGLQVVGIVGWTLASFRR